MSCQSAIYTVNTNATIAASATVPFGSVVRRYGRSCQLDGSGINLMGPGYYKVDCSITFTPTSGGEVTVQLYQDGTAIPGAVASAQGTAAEPINLCVVALVRNCGCDCNTSLTATISAAGVADSISTVVEKK